MKSMCGQVYCNKPEIIFKSTMRELPRIINISYWRKSYLSNSKCDSKVAYSPLKCCSNWFTLCNALTRIPLRHLYYLYSSLLFAYQCFHQFGPSYLIELLTQYKPERTLRSSKKSLFCVPQTMTRSYRERSFSYAAPVLWNNLPEHVRNIDTYEKFRTSLKTHLFNTSYMS